MVIFCNKCKRALDDSDKFCRFCGHNTKDSIDYHTYYSSIINGEKDSMLALWSKIGEDITFLREIKDIKEKVDIIYQKLFPSSVVGLRDDIEKETIGVKIEDSVGIKVEETIEEKVEDSVGTKVEETIEKKVEDSVGTKVEETVEEKVEDSVGTKVKDDVEKETIGVKIEEKGYTQSPKEGSGWPWPEDNSDTDVAKKKDDADDHKEVSDKLDLLLQEEKGHKQVVQYLIDRYSRQQKDKLVNVNVVGDKPGNVKPVDNSHSQGIILVPKKDMGDMTDDDIGDMTGVTHGTHTTDYSCDVKEKVGRYKKYYTAIRPFIPGMLEDIKSSKDGIIRMRLSDVAKKMGEKFVNKKPATIYIGLRYALFEHNVVVELGSLKEIDPVTQKNVKVLMMRMRNRNDMLPPSLLEKKVGV